MLKRLNGNPVLNLINPSNILLLLMTYAQPDLDILGREDDFSPLLSEFNFVLQQNVVGRVGHTETQRTEMIP